MDKHNETTILAKFLPYLRLIQAAEPDNFRPNGGWRSIPRSLFHSLGAICVTFAMSIAVILITWKLLENDGGASVLVVSIPVLMSSIQVLVTFVALMWESRTISEAIGRIHEIVSHRKHFSLRLVTID